MHFLKTLFWVVLAVIAVTFSLRNWIAVPVNLWAGLTADVKLPLLLGIFILIGMLPTYAVQRARIWRLHRRIDTLERNSPPSPAAVAAEPVASLDDPQS